MEYLYKSMQERWINQNRKKDITIIQDIDGIQTGLYIHPDRDWTRYTFYLLKNGTPIGAVTGDSYDNCFNIKVSVVAPEERNKGLATRLYEEIFNLFDKVESDFDLSIDAQNLWQKLQKKWPEKIIKKETASSGYIMNKSPKI